MDIAVVGSGISGLTTAHLLSKNHDVTLFEKEDRLGGHTATIDFELDGENYAIDTGFIVFNDWTYPNFIQLLNELKIESLDSSMGFSVTCPQSGLEYAGNNLNTLFAQRKNLVSPKFLRLVLDILRFNREVQKSLAQDMLDESMTLGAYLDQKGYSEWFSHYYLIPMGSAIWSMSCEKMREFPLLFFATFFKNHGLLNVKERPTWRVISGGSKQYIAPLIQSFKDKIRLNSNISHIVRKKKDSDIDHPVKIFFTDGTCEEFDQVVLATHSDQALSLLETPSKLEQEILSSIEYEDNRVVLHHDESLLPRNKLTWSSWNYKISKEKSVPPTLTYNMNILQRISANKTFCVTLNDDTIANEKIIGDYTYAHPQFTLAGELAKARWQEINGVNKTWFCGAYWRNGFHEDGVVSAIRVAEAIEANNQE